MNTLCCPDHAALAGYLHGNSEDAELDAHLDECSACRAALDQLDADVNRPFACLGQTPEPTSLDSTFEALVAGVRTMSFAKSERFALQPGDTFGNYEIVELVARSGMGDVFAATHLHLKKTVALKLIRPNLLSEEQRSRFRREMEAVGRLSSPHIVVAFDAGRNDGVDFLAMEYIEGETFAKLLQRRGPLPLRQALDYILQAARGLAHAHAAGIVHRDVKPANLMLDRRCIVKVLDLGLARIADNDDENRGIMGTPFFMPPEQALTNQVDERADVYSLGCTLYYLLAGEPPYHDTSSAPQVLAAHREQPIPALREKRPDCPADVDALVQQMLAKQPDDRPASMNAVVLELERLLTRHKQPASFDWRIAIAASIIISLLGVGSIALMTSAGGTPGEPKSNPTPIVSVPKKDATPLIEMALIPSGKFMMGASDTDPNANADEKPRREIKINRPFLIGKTEITQAQYEEVMGNNPAAFSKKGAMKTRVKDLDTTRHPVESVSWHDAIRFCNRLSERHGLEPYYKIGEKEVVTIKGGAGYRLPTEAEWEYACRGDTTTTWYFGENQTELKDHAWLAGNSDDRTHPVGQKKANPFGLFDMYGNVPEWCWDRYAENYYKNMPYSDPPGAGIGNARVYRGGAWNTLLPRSSVRIALGPTYGGQGSINIIGFRVARNVVE